MQTREVLFPTNGLNMQKWNFLVFTYDPINTEFKVSQVAGDGSLQKTSLIHSSIKLDNPKLILGRRSPDAPLTLIASFSRLFLADIFFLGVGREIRSHYTKEGLGNMPPGLYHSAHTFGYNQVIRIPMRIQFK